MDPIRIRKETKEVVMDIVGLDEKGAPDAMVSRTQDLGFTKFFKFSEAEKINT